MDGYGSGTSFRAKRVKFKMYLKFSAIGLVALFTVATIAGELVMWLTHY